LLLGLISPPTWRARFLCWNMERKNTLYEWELTTCYRQMFIICLSQLDLLTSVNGKTAFGPIEKRVSSGVEMIPNTGAGAYVNDMKREFGFSLGLNRTLFHSEVYAIKACDCGAIAYLRFQYFMEPRDCHDALMRKVLGLRQKCRFDRGYKTLKIAMQGPCKS
jgi:hypothetical protein